MQYIFIAIIALLIGFAYGRKVENTEIIILAVAFVQIAAGLVVGFQVGKIIYKELNE